MYSKAMRKSQKLGGIRRLTHVVKAALSCVHLAGERWSYFWVQSWGERTSQCLVTFHPVGKGKRQSWLKSPTLSISDAGREESVVLLPTVFSYHHPPRTCVKGCRRRHSDIRRTSGTSLGLQELFDLLMLLITWQVPVQTHARQNLSLERVGKGVPAIAEEIWSFDSSMEGELLPRVWPLVG